MPKITTPSPGQPLDVAYIGTLANAINDLDNAVNANSTLASSYIGTSTNRIRTSSLTFSAQTFDYGTLNQLDAGKSSVAVTTTGFGVTFKDIPVVTATIINTASDSSNKALTVNIKKVTTTTVEFEVVSAFKMTGTPTLKINIIAIGYTQ